MNTCETCKHWLAGDPMAAREFASPYGWLYFAPEQGKRLGHCQRANQFGAPFAAVNEGESIGGELITEHSFGCNQWAPKPEARALA